MISPALNVLCISWDFRKEKEYWKNKKYIVQNHVLYSKSLDTIYLVACTIPTHFTTSEKVYYIARGTFCENQSIQSIALQSAIYQIQEFAFEGCVNLKTAKFMDIVDRIGRFAFDRDEKIILSKGTVIKEDVLIRLYTDYEVQGI